MVAHHQQLRAGQFLFLCQPPLLRHGAVPGDQGLIVAHIQMHGHAAFIVPAIFCRSVQSGVDFLANRKIAVRSYVCDLHPMPPGAVLNINREFLRHGRNDQLPQFQHLHQHGHAVAVVLMKMGQYQHVYLVPSPAEQVAAGQLPGIVQAVDPAAVDQHRAVPSHSGNAKPLAHIQHGDGLPPLGIVPGSTAQKQA